MPRFNRLAAENNRYNTIFQSKTCFTRINGDDGESITFTSEDTPIPYDVPLDYDCNWFLAVGGRVAEVSGCQLGVSYKPYTRPVERLQFPGEVTYLYRPGVSKRGSMSLYTTRDYTPGSPVEIYATSYLAELIPIQSSSATYLFTGNSPPPPAQQTLTFTTTDSSLPPSQQTLTFTVT